jgi:CDP-diacylglycerol--glycerol-3-phosphate 3-phosphatidyltransferase
MTHSGRHVRERRTAVVAAAAVVVAGVLGGRAFVTAATDSLAANRWLAVMGGVLAWELGVLASHRDPDRPEVTFALPNLVTLVRGGLYAAAAGFIVVPPATPAVRWAPAVCYGAGVALDAVDGALARWRDSETRLGTRLDLAFDTLGFLVAPLVGVAWGRLPVWYLSLSAARYCYRAGVWWHERRGGTASPLPESRIRRPLAALQMVFIAVALAPVLPVDIVRPASAVVLTPSLVVFGRDYLAVTGRGEY